MSDSQIQLVVFDLGGVIVRICRSWAEGCRAAGVPVHNDPATPEQLLRRRNLVLAYQEGRIDCDAFFRGIAATTGGLHTPDEVRRVHDAWILEEYAGVGGVADALESAGVKSGVLSNTNHAHWRRLCPADGPCEFPTVRRFAHVHASHILRVSKPDPAIYAAFERATGQSGRGGSILFFDDLIENVEAARSAGWRAVQVDHAGDTAAQIHEHLRAHRVL